MAGASFQLNPSPVFFFFSNRPLKRKHKHTHAGSSFSPPPLKSLHLFPLLKRVREWMRHNRQRGCHGDSRSVWAGFLSWPLVKQTSKVGRQSHSLVPTASFTPSTASIARVHRAWHRPVPPLHGSLPYITAPDGIVMVNLPQSSSSTKQALLSKHAAAQREAC